MPKGSSSWPDAARLAAGLLAAALLALQAVGPLRAPLRAQSQLDLTRPIQTDRPIGYFIGSPDDVEGARETDRELCAWALDDWVRASAGRLEVAPAAEDAALIRIYFASPMSGQYGETRPILVDGRRGADVYVRPSTDALGPDIAAAARADPLLRDSIVYLTCLHEIGHALGLEHTDAFADIMYFFGYGGDIPAFFGRYRARLTDRQDIRRESGLADADVARLRRLYPPD
jgi:Matrixin